MPVMMRRLIVSNQAVAQLFVPCSAAKGHTMADGAPDPDAEDTEVCCCWEAWGLNDASSCL